MSSLKERFESKIFYGIDGCHYWLGNVNKKGYGRVRTSNYPRDKSGMTSAHRVAYNLYVGEIPKGLHVLHSCDNPCCVNHNHLFLGTNDENVKDKVCKNRQFRPIGDKHPQAKLSIAKVLHIRANKGILRTEELASMHGIRPNSVYDIWTRKSWKHI